VGVDERAGIRSGTCQVSTSRIPQWILLCKTHHSGFDHYVFYIRWIKEVSLPPHCKIHPAYLLLIITLHKFLFQTNQFVIVNHSREPDYEAVHGKLLHFETDTKRCPFPTAFLWHEYRVRGFYPTCGDCEVTTHKGGDIFGFAPQRGGELRTGNDRGSVLDIHTSGELSSGTGANAGAHNRFTTNSSGHDSDDVISFTPVPLVGDDLVSWLAAARQHSSWKDCIVENMSWDGTAAENIDKYQREVGVEKGL